MKAIKFFAMLLTAAVMTMGAASCGNDDEEIEDIEKEVTKGKIQGIYTIEQGKLLRIEVQFTDVKKIEEATFVNGEMVTWVEIEEYAKQAACDEVWKAMQENLEESMLKPYTKKDNQIICDMAMTSGKGGSFEWFKTEMFDGHVKTYKDMGVVFK